MMNKNVISAVALLALLSGAAFAKPATTAPKAKAPVAQKSVSEHEGILQSVDAKSVTITQKGKVEKFELAQNARFTPNRAALKPGARVRLDMDKAHHIAAINLVS